MLEKFARSRVNDPAAPRHGIPAIRESYFETLRRQVVYIVYISDVQKIIYYVSLKSQSLADQSFLSIFLFADIHKIMKIYDINNCCSYHCVNK